MLFRGFPSFSASKSAARPSKRARSQPEPTQTAPTAPTLSKKPSRLQTVLRALHLSRSQRKVDEQYHHHQVNDILPMELQPPCPATHEGPTLSASARGPWTPSTPFTFPYSTLSTADPARLTVPPSAATSPATIFSSSPAALAPYSTLPATDPATDPTEAIKRIAHLESTISQLERDNARQISKTNALFKDKILPRIDGFAEERDTAKVARKLAEDRLEEEIACQAKMEELIAKERKQHRRAERARLEACYALEEKNAELRAALLDLQAPTDLLDFEALQQPLVRLGIIDSDNQQDPQAFCIAPFLKSVCAAATRGTTNSKKGQEQEQKKKQELETPGHRAFDVSDDGDSCSEPVFDEPPKALSRAPAPTQWFKNGPTRPKRFA